VETDCFLLIELWRFYMKRLRDMSLKYKASLVILTVALIPLFVLGTCIVAMYSNAIEERSRMHIEENIRIMTSRINAVFLNADLCGNHILLNLNQIEDENIRQQITKDNKIHNLLNQSVLIFDGIESIVYVSEQGEFYTTNIHLLDQKEEIMASSYLKQLLDANGKTRLFDKTENCMEVKNEVVTMGKKVTHIVSGETLGYLFVNIAGDYLVQSVQNSISDYMVFDNQGKRIVEHTNGEFPEEEGFYEYIYANQMIREYTYEREEYLIARREIPEYHWEIVGITNLDKFNVSSQELMAVGMVVGCLVTVLMAVAIFAATAMVTKPLLKLKRGAEEIASGNLEIQFAFQTRDEIGKLGEIFNLMTRKIRELLQRVDSEARKKREYELALLHEQLKPHFLYNTLDIVVVLIEMKREWEAAHVARRLAAYYKNCLSSSEEIIPLDREIQIIEAYLELQNIRYGEKFTYEISVQENMSEVYLPRLTLQPLVENSIYHGLKYREEWGGIQVDIYMEEGYIYIKVSDDGIGIPEDTLQKLQSFAEKPEKHFGLYSVKHRLQLYYGEETDMQIHSRYGEGTCITIRIPKEKQA